MTYPFMIYIVSFKITGQAYGGWVRLLRKMARKSEVFVP
eukprot:CAMPEP_0175042620 /NCGR_PEP_ID=MMETSP0052_2-20121109/2682_1 /TAXON_ID=51329 ORGANISM="Polytomella parva, Strain SAG 63-3" /NCGR_SAMPLE_ID=MMETSP0052_2 /ASSEMBLY_ACC=CAM_ASM_000194 /LENGTH=38 /DNA_ID= /DNA_START= /DNA_END= /DNA_ORIENTATION=